MIANRTECPVSIKNVWKHPSAKIHDFPQKFSAFWEKEVDSLTELIFKNFYEAYAKNYINKPVKQSKPPNQTISLQIKCWYDPLLSLGSIRNKWNNGNGRQMKEELKIQRHDKDKMLYSESNEVRIWNEWRLWLEISILEFIILEVMRW